MRRRFFFLAVKLSWPLSVFESVSESELDESELDDDDDELELLELSDAKPVLSSKLTRAATSASGGSFSYIETFRNSYSRVFYILELNCIQISLPSVLATISSRASDVRVLSCARQLGNSFCCRSFA